MCRMPRDNNVGQAYKQDFQGQRERRWSDQESYWVPAVDSRAACYNFSILKKKVMTREYGKFADNDSSSCLGWQHMPGSVMEGSLCRETESGSFGDK